MGNPVFNQSTEDYQRIEQAIKYIEANASRQPELGEIAASLHLSEYHFQRLFTRWAGISPKRFLQFVTKENAKVLLSRSHDLLEATYGTGLSSPGRLHDLFIQTEAVTPGEYKNKGKGIRIDYGYHPSPFGECFLALTDRGICWLAFTDGDRTQPLEDLSKAWANAYIRENASRISEVVQQIFHSSPGVPLILHLHGTNFQMKVWEALLKLPSGQVTCYENLAEQVATSRSTRAVAHAVAQNPVAFLIPCHRVLRKSGEFGEYRYGSTRKKAILAWEASH